MHFLLIYSLNLQEGTEMLVDLVDSESAVDICLAFCSLARCDSLTFIGG